MPHDVRLGRCQETPKAPDAVREHRQRKEKLETAAEEEAGEILANRRMVLGSADTTAAFDSRDDRVLKTGEAKETKAFA